MEKGYNSDVTIQGTSYHVQTEDWGHHNPFLVSRIYRNGAVIRSIKRPYAEVLRQGPSSDQQAIRLALQEQHHKILDLLLSGHWLP